MTNQPKLSWEVSKTSLILRVADGAKKTEWKLTKNMGSPSLISIFNELVNALWQAGPAPWEGKPMTETVRTVDAEELAESQRAWETRSGVSVQANTEEDSMRALKAKADAVSIGAKWFEADDDETYSVSIPDYDTGEI